jgi:endonuclease-3
MTTPGTAATATFVLYMFHMRMQASAIMQLMLALDDRPHKLADIHRRLWRRFGPPGPFHRLDPVSQLVMGIIGGKTRGEVSIAAFEALLARFGRWQAVRDVSAAEIEAAIAAVTYAERKAPRLKLALQKVTAPDGRPTLDGLDTLTVTDALAWLERLPGVGRKTAAATLNFSTLRKPTLVIDSHHRRVLQRLGLLARRCSFANAHDCIMPLLPPGWTADDMDDHHQLMKTLGQRICTHGKPTCHRCPLRDLCPTAN